MVSRIVKLPLYPPYSNAIPTVCLCVCYQVVSEILGVWRLQMRLCGHFPNEVRTAISAHMYKTYVMAQIVRLCLIIYG